MIVWLGAGVIGGVLLARFMRRPLMAVGLATLEVLVVAAVMAIDRLDVSVLLSGVVFALAMQTAWFATILVCEKRTAEDTEVSKRPARRRDLAPTL